MIVLLYPPSFAFLDYVFAFLPWMDLLMLSSLHGKQMYPAQTIALNL